MKLIPKYQENFKPGSAIQAMIIKMIFHEAFFQKFIEHV